MIKKRLYILYTLYCYLITGIALLCFVLFFENVFLTKTVSFPISNEVTIRNLFTNIGLMLIFGIQHSIMARQRFKRWWTRFIPKPIERATYLLLSSLALALVVWQWQPFGPAIYNISDSPFGILLIGISLTGLLISGISALSIDAKFFMGWRQASLEQTEDSKRFVTPLLYQYVRHPIYFGFLIAIWSTPIMTLSHVLFGACLTCYIIVGTALEEKSLIEQFGDLYLDYQREVPMFIPFMKLKWY